MKPFTLEWWIKRMANSIGAYEGSRLRGDLNGMKRYADLADWISQRIINKYAQHEQTADSS